MFERFVPVPLVMFVGICVSCIRSTKSLKMYGVGQDSDCRYPSAFHNPLRLMEPCSDITTNIAPKFRFQISDFVKVGNRCTVGSTEMISVAPEASTNAPKALVTSESAKAASSIA